MIVFSSKNLSVAPGKLQGWRLKPFALMCLLSGWLYPLHAQILMTDRFGQVRDTTKAWQGLFNMGFNADRQREVIYRFNPELDLSHKRNGLRYTCAASYTLVQRGKESILNSGFLYFLLRPTQAKTLTPEAFTQYQADGIRGMEYRYLLGGNYRLTLIQDSVGNLLQYGLGLMYESERWNYSGVVIPLHEIPQTQNFNFIKINTFIRYSYRFSTGYRLRLISFLQARPDAFIQYPRLAFQTEMDFPGLGRFNVMLSGSGIYDALPMVPIYKFYFSVMLRLGIRLG
jgi:hypothetical protein